MLNVWLSWDLEELGKVLSENPTTGDYLGNDVYKIRIAIKSKGKGKRGGGRVMKQIKVINEKVYMVSIYSQGEKDDISDSEIHELIKDIE